MRNGWYNGRHKIYGGHSAIEREMYILTTIINHLLQESTLIGRLQRISGDLEDVLTEIDLRVGLASIT